MADKLLKWVSGAISTFKVSATQGGAGVNLTATGSGKVRKVTPKIVNAGDTFRFQAGALTLPIF